MICRKKCLAWHVFKLLIVFKRQLFSQSAINHHQVTSVWALRGGQIDVLL